MYPDYDCICMYNTTFLRTLNEEPAVYCNDCGSLKIRGLPRERPMFLNRCEDEVIKIRGQVRDLQEFNESIPTTGTNT